MRLIDKDATIKALKNNPVGKVVAGLGLDGWLESRQEVQAITVDWIEEYIDAEGNVDGLAAKFIVAAITDMVEAWKSENKHSIDEGKADQNEGS